MGFVLRYRNNFFVSCAEGKTGLRREIVPPAIDDARENALLNGIENAQFLWENLKKSFRNTIKIMKNSTEEKGTRM